MRHEIIRYDGYDQLEIYDKKFYSHGDESNFFFLLEKLGVDASGNEKCIVVDIYVDLHVRHGIELISLLRRYNFELDEIKKIRALSDIISSWNRID